MKHAPTIFTVGVSGTKLKAECRIYQSQREMLVAARRFGATIGNDTMALCEGDPKLMPRGRFVIVFLSRTHLTHGAIAHEMVHASLCLLARRKRIKSPALSYHLDTNTEDEETHASIVDELVEGFHKKYGI